MLAWRSHWIALFFCFSENSEQGDFYYCAISEKIASGSRKCFIRFLNIICYSVSTNVGLTLLGSQTSLKFIFIHKVASFFLQVHALFEYLHIIICLFLPKHSCHLFLSLSLLPQSFSCFPTVMLQRGCSLPSVKSAINGTGIKRREDRDVKLHYGYYASGRDLPAAGWFSACACDS